MPKETMIIFGLVRFWVAVAATLMLTGCASGSGSGVTVVDQQKRQQALAASDHLIIPGERIGPIRLGMGMDEVAATLGQPDYADTTQYSGAHNRTTWEYHSLNMVIFFPAVSAPSVDGVATVVYTKHTMTIGEMTWADMEPITTMFQTAKGIGLGASSFDAKRAYSSFNYSEREGSISMDYETLGISFGLSRDHRIYKINVYPR